MFLPLIAFLLLGAALAKPAPEDSQLDGNTRAGSPEPVPYADKPLLQEPINKPEYTLSLAAGGYYWRSHSTFGTDNYPNNYDVKLKLTGANGEAVSISCHSFNLENEASCGYDYLSINGDKYCGSNPVPIISSKMLDVSFHTDYSVVNPGFSCRVVVGCMCGVHQSSRVVGGSNAAAGQFPSQAGLVPNGGTRTFCGGSVINNRYVLTAAHCTAGQSPGQFEVLLGNLLINTVEASEQRFSVVKIIDYPGYTDISNGWDFSLLKLNRDITFTSTVSPVCLADAGQTYAGATAIASGYGRTGATAPQATTLQYVTLPVWSQSKCATKWSVKSSMLCAGGYDQGGRAVCMGDSGGPLVTQVAGRSQLIGVVSFGRACAWAGVPDVFARVTEALPWIATNTADAQYCY